jgi:hypothetical protein
VGFERMRQGVMVVCAPFVKVVGNVVASRIGRRVLKVDDDELGSASKEG